MWTERRKATAVSEEISYQVGSVLRKLPLQVLITVRFKEMMSSSLFGLYY